ncbi:MAG: hypothetical protein HY658_06705 [Actinobacteria bacterium]|nr:hypothetical protein [Actinomycetota bacterium]
MIVEERAPATPRAVAAGRSRARWTPLGALLAILPAIAITELLLVRTFYRVGIFIPKEGPFRTVYAAATTLGSFALNLASVVAVLALVGLVVTAIRRGRIALAAGVGGFVAGSAVATLFQGQYQAPVVRLLFALAVASVAWPHVARRDRLLERLAVGGVVAAALLSSYAGLAADAGSVGPGPLPGGTFAELAGEAMVVAAGFLVLATWVAREGFRWGPVAWTAPVPAAVVGLWSASGAITGILVLWTAGLRLYLPLWIYAGAAWAWAAAAAGWARSRPWHAVGLLLLPPAGFLLGTTYQQSLLLLAVVLLTDGMALGGLPRWPGREPDPEHGG